MLFHARGHNAAGRLRVRALFLDLGQLFGRQRHEITLSSIESFTTIYRLMQHRNRHMCDPSRIFSIVHRAPLDTHRQRAKLQENTNSEKEQTMGLKYLHTMVRVKDLEKSMAFFKLLGLQETRRYDSEEGRFSLIFLAPPGQEDAPIELTWNWDGDDALPSDSRHFGHLAYGVDNIYETCQHLADNGIVINRPPRDGRMAFVRSPDNISVELLQNGEALPAAEPWASMESTGHW